MNDIKLHLVSHVHWDPAWYSTFEEYRIRLLGLMKNILNILDNNEEYISFMFDGQVSAIDDYLEILPCEEERIRRHTRNGRLIIGPWYILPEEFMISGESLIRNLLLGSRRGKELGGVMKVSYLCDMVGHIPQMPQIVRGFGYEYYCGWRGVIDGKERNESEFIWEAPDGSQVIFKVMPYSYHTQFPNDLDANKFIEHVKKLKEGLLPHATTEYILIMQGGDHQQPFMDTPEYIKAYNRLVRRDEIVQTTLQNHIDCIKEKKESLKIHRGELRSTYQSFILTGILTTRMEVKLENERITRDLEKWVEPFCSFSSLLGDPYPDQLIQYAWKRQIINSFHDCIYGAHADEVTPDIMNNYKRSGEISKWLIGDSLYNISRKIDTTGRELNVTFFNPTAWTQKNTVVDFEVFLEDDNARTELVAKDQAGCPLETQVRYAKRTRRFCDLSGNIKGDTRGVEGFEYGLTVRVPELPGLGYCNIKIDRANWNNKNDRKQYLDIIRDWNVRRHVFVFPNGCENEYLKVEIDRNGLINILDKETNTWYKNMHMFEDSGDAGDNYNFSPPVENQIITNKGGNARISLVEQGPLKATYKVEFDMEIPCCLEEGYQRSKRLVTNTIEYYVSLKAYSRTVEFKTCVTNRSCDHRLRILFPAGFDCDKSYAGSQFGIIDRTTQEASGIYDEKPMGNHPHRLFVDVTDGNSGFAFFDRGLPEYQLSPRGDLYITLLRCTGILSKDTFPERSYNHAGPGIKTPGAQELGEHIYEYALYFHSGDWKQSRCYKYSQQFYAPIKAIQGDAHSGVLPPSLSFVSVEPDQLVFSAFKKSSDDKWIVRVYNVLDEECEGIFTFFKPVRSAFRTNLNEEKIEEIPVEHNKIHLKIGPHKIITCALTF